MLAKNLIDDSMKIEEEVADYLKKGEWASPGDFFAHQFDDYSFKLKFLACQYDLEALMSLPNLMMNFPVPALSNIIW